MYCFFLTASRTCSSAVNTRFTLVLNFISAGWTGITWSPAVNACFILILRSIRASWTCNQRNEIGIKSFYNLYDVRVLFYVSIAFMSIRIDCLTQWLHVTSKQPIPTAKNISFCGIRVTCKWSELGML